MRKREQGILTVEASIVLTFMTLFVLFLFSFIRVYRAENMVSHATLQAADAMALESYLRENALDDKATDVVYLANRLTGTSTLNVENFESLRSANVPTIAKEKFVAAVSNSEANANTILTNYGVKNGLSGVDFSTSTVDLDRDDVIVNVSYTLKMQFPIFGATEINVTKSAKAKTFGEILFEITAEPEDPKMGSTSGSGNYQHGTTIQITANPNYGYKFVRWDDDGEGNTDNPRTVSVSDAYKYVAIFEADSFAVITDVSPNQSPAVGTVSGGGEYLYLSTANLTATATPGYHFNNWSVWKHKDDAPGSAPDDSNVSLTVDQIYTYTANFLPNQYTIKVAKSVPSGFSGATASFKIGADNYTSKTLTYDPTLIMELISSAPTGCRLSKWTVTSGGETANIPSSVYNGFHIPASTPVSNKPLANGAEIVLTAVFERTPHTVTVISDGNGTVSGGGTYYYGDIVNISASPSTHYEFDHWEVVAGTKDSGNQFRVISNITYKAIFKIKKYTVSFDSNGGSSISSITVTAGSYVNFSAYIPSRGGYNFSGWYSGANQYAGKVAITSNLSVTANWSCSHPGRYETRTGTVCEGGTIYYKCTQCNADLGTASYPGNGHSYTIRCNINHVFTGYFNGVATGGCGTKHVVGKYCGTCRVTHGSKKNQVKGYCRVCKYCHYAYPPGSGGYWCGQKHAGNSSKQAVEPVNGHRK